MSIKILLNSILFFILITLFNRCHQDFSPDQNCEELLDYPQIDPDYTDLIIPPNIAPLNFRIQEDGFSYYVKIYSDEHELIKIHSKTNQILIPIRQWKVLLEKNKGKDIHISIYSKDKIGNWKKYKTIKNKVAPEEIDSHVVYRLINPGYVGWNDMGIVQRNIENYQESAILTNRVTKKNCMNCHSFCQNDPDLMLFHMRASLGGTIIYKDHMIQKINTKTKTTLSAGVYPSWHPEGNHIAFSVNKIYQKFHGSTGESIYVYDAFSNLIIYNIKTNTITTSPAVSTKRLENLPCWSPDGTLLYFCSAQKKKEMKYSEVRYDLMRIGYDIHSNEWGEPEEILESSETGKSISFPKISPDGKYLLFCMSDYGYFHVHFKSSDLYLMDLSNYQYYKPDINSTSSESYHSWSSNSRWFVFVSKRRDGLCSRLYFSYVDDQGEVSKPFLLPQKNPEFYDTFIKNYNLPEMIKGPVTIDRRKLARVAQSEAIDVEFDPLVDVDGLTGATEVGESELQKKY